MQWTTRTWIWKVMMWRDTSASSTQISQTVFVCTIMHKNLFFRHFCFLLLFLMMMMIPVLCKKLMLLQWYSSYCCFFAICRVQEHVLALNTYFIFIFVHCLPIHFSLTQLRHSLPVSVFASRPNQPFLPCFSVCMHCMSLDSCLSSDRDITTLWLWLVSAISGQINLRKDT